jgi:hypothetical protein
LLLLQQILVFLSLKNQELKAEYYKALEESYLTALRRFQHLSNVNVADDEERSYTDSTTDSKFDRVFDGLYHIPTW